jgi:hypothetical protein
MFDEVHWQGRVWQTKEFECMMTTFHIRDGRLIQELYDYSEERGSFVSGEVDTNFHGVIELCDWAPGDARSINGGRELEIFELKFTDGLLMSWQKAG